MRLLRLAATGFRNLEPFELRTEQRFVVFHGPNAQGKTNALEAIYLLATLKPLRGHRTRELVCWGADAAAVAGTVRHDGLERQLRVELEATGRKVTLDGKSPSDLADYFAAVRAISFVPSDAEIVSGEPAQRRAWIDRAAFTRSPTHLDVVRGYKRVVDQKAALLKSPAPDRVLLDALDDQLAQAGARLVERRVALLREVEPHVLAVHERIAGKAASTLALRYRTQAAGAGVEARAEALRQAIGDARPEELRRGFCTVGPHTDDVRIQLDGRSARTFGSRGQVRSLVLALKLAELVAARERGQTPLFLLDDVSSELDRARTGRLVEVLAELGTQVFASTTDPEHMDRLPADETLRVAVEAGRLAVQPAL